MLGRLKRLAFNLPSTAVENSEGFYRYKEIIKAGGERQVTPKANLFNLNRNDSRLARPLTIILATPCAPRPSDPHGIGAIV